MKHLTPSLFAGLLTAVLLTAAAPTAPAAPAQNGPGAYTFAAPDAKTDWQTKAGLPADYRAVTPTCGYSLGERTVYLLAESCGLGKGYECEYTLVSRLSDRAYESLAIAWDLPSAIARAVTALGIRPGVPANPARGLTNARGERFTVSLRDLTQKDSRFLPLGTFLSDEWSTPAQNLFGRGFPFAGSAWDDRQMPSAVIANYTEAYSVFGLPYQAVKGEAYGAFRARTDMAAGAPVAVALHWERLPDGRGRVLNHRLDITETAIARPLVLLDTLRRLCEDPRDIFLDIRIDPKLKAAALTRIAQLILKLEEQGGFTLDAPAAGEVPLRAFVPDRHWLNRRARIFQPWEVEISPATALRPASAVLCQIKEDWTAEGNDPALTRVCYPMVTPGTIRSVLRSVDVNSGKIYVAFFYAAPGVTVGDIRPYADALKDDCPTQWIFTDVGASPLTESERALPPGAAHR